MAPKPLTFDEMAQIHDHEKRLERLHMQGADLEALAYNGRWLPPWFQQVPAFARMANVPAPPIAPATPATRPVPAAEFQNDASIAPETKRQRAKEYLEATLGNPSASSASGASSDLQPQCFQCQSSHARTFQWDQAPRTRRLLAGKPN